jgi:plastocyanin
MRFPRHVLASLALLSVVPLGCGGSSEQATPPEMTSAATMPRGESSTSKVTIAHFSYEPRTLVVRRGTRVTWTNEDDAPHTVTSTAKPRAFDSKALDTDDTFSHVFDAPGTYEYFCALHPKMTAKVVVK